MIDIGNALRQLLKDLEEIGHPLEGNCPICGQIFDTHSEECLVAQTLNNIRAILDGYNDKVKGENDESK